MSKKTIIVADDIEMNRAVLKKFIGKEFHILEAENGLEVMQLLQENRVDILLLDIVMPIMDGLQVLEKVQVDYPNRAFGILVATSTKEKTERAALSLGADDIVSKPYDPVVIKKRLENILAARELELHKNEVEKKDGDSFTQGDIDRIQETLEEKSAVFLQMAELVKYNKDNQDLLVEIAEKIKKEAGTLPKILL